VLGDCCRTSSQHGRPRITISVCGGWTARGSISTLSSASNSASASAATLSQARRSSMASRSEPLASAVSVATMVPNASTAANATFSSTPAASSFVPKCTQQTSRIAPAYACCSTALTSSFPAYSISGSTRGTPAVASIGSKRSSGATRKLGRVLARSGPLSSAGTRHFLSAAPGCAALSENIPRRHRRGRFRSS
jgi:hypothetical protein